MLSNICSNLIPIIKKNLIKTNNLIIDTKSGYSGAGKNFEKKFHHRNLYSSTFAYGIKIIDMLLK